MNAIHIPTLQDLAAATKQPAAASEHPAMTAHNPATPTPATAADPSTPVKRKVGRPPLPPGVSRYKPRPGRKMKPKEGKLVHVPLPPGPPVMQTLHLNGLLPVIKAAAEAKNMTVASFLRGVIMDHLGVPYETTRMPRREHATSRAATPATQNPNA